MRHGRTVTGKRRWQPWIGALSLVVAAAASGDGRTNARMITLIVTAPLPIDLDHVTWSPARAARLAGRGRSGWPELAVDTTLAGDTLSVHAPGACPKTVALNQTIADDVIAQALTPLFMVRGENPQLGFDARFELELVPQCAEAARVGVEWKPVDAERVRDFGVSDDRRTAHGKTLSFAAAHPAPIAWGIVPLSPATRGEIELETRWKAADGDVALNVRVAAAARATGIPIVAPGQRLLLGGAGWHVRERAQAGRADVVADSPARPATFEPDAVGRWVLEDAQGRALAITVGRHSQLRLDCGRTECHPRATADAAASPMTSVLARGLSGELGRDYVPQCAISCHAVGEPGLADGGFVNTARAIGYQLPQHAASSLWDELPRPLRRLGGVGCTSCHGPAAIPEPESRWAILRSDVCAVCHDAPPRYRHVDAWRSSRMATAARATLTRDRKEGCDACHSVVGFLARIGVREFSPPRDPLGITCAACHAPHGSGSSRALVRKVSLPPQFAALEKDGEASTKICIACHAPLDESGYPAQSTALLWLGDERHPSPHRAVPGGCVGCHMRARARTPPDGSGHTFRADLDACASCHPNAWLAERSSPAGRISDRAHALWARLASLGVIESSSTGPPHALGSRAMRPSGEPWDRVIENTRLVLEDPAAWVHNGPYARALLDEAERGLERAAR